MNHLRSIFWFSVKINLDLSEFGQTLGLNAEAEAPLFQFPPYPMHVIYNVSGTNLGITTIIYAFFTQLTHDLHPDHI